MEMMEMESIVEVVETCSDLPSSAPQLQISFPDVASSCSDGIIDLICQLLLRSAWFGGSLPGCDSKGASVS